MKHLITLALYSTVLTVLTSCQNHQPSPHNYQLHSAAYDNVRWVPAFGKNGIPIDELIKSADCEFHLDGNNQLLSQTKKHDHFSLRKNKVSSASRDLFTRSFIVVQLYKVAQIEKVDQKVSKINSFFFSRGANRVLITGFRGSGTSVYSDKIATPSKATSSKTNPNNTKQARR